MFKPLERARNSLVNFSHTYAKSLTSPAYYKSVLDLPVKSSIGYFIVLSILASYVAGIPFFAQIRNFNQNQILDQAVQNVINAYPQDMVVTVANGELTLNKPDPFVLKMDPPLNANENFFVYDSDGTIDDYYNYKTLIMANKTNVILNQAQNANPTPKSLTILPIKQLVPEDKTINADEAISSLQKFRFSINNFYTVLVSLMALGAPVALVLRNIVFALLFSLIGLVLFKLNKLTLGFKKVLQVTMHMLTLFITLEAVIAIAFYFLNSYTQLYTIVGFANFAGVLIAYPVIIRELKK